MYGETDVKRPVKNVFVVDKRRFIHVFVSWLRERFQCKERAG